MLKISNAILTIVTFSIGLFLSATAVSASSPTYDFQIERLPLQEAILEFAVARNLEVIFVADVAEGIVANALKGNYTMTRALEILFEGTGLRARFTTDRAITIEKIPVHKRFNFFDRPRVTPPPVEESTDAPELFDALPEVLVVAKLISPYRLGVTSSSTKTQRHFLETPQVVNALSEQLIEDTASRDYSDISQLASSVDFLEANSGVMKELRLRGFAYPALKLNGFASHAYMRPPDITFIERIDVAKGPTSVLYGRMEPGGVINMVLKRPYFDPYRAIKLRMSDQDYQKFVLDVSTPIGADIWARAIVFGQKEGQRNNFDQDDNRGLSVSLEKELGSGASMSLNYRFERQAAAKRFGTPSGQITQQIQIAEIDGTFLLIDSILEDLKTLVDFDSQSAQFTMDNIDYNGWGINLQLQMDWYDVTSVNRYPFIESNALVEAEDALAALEDADDFGSDVELDQAIEALEVAITELDIGADDIDSFDVQVENDATFFSGELTALKIFDVLGYDVEQLYGLNLSHTKPEQLILQNHDTRGTFNRDDDFLSIDDGDTPIDVTEDNIALFGQWIFNLNERVTVFLGGRYDYINLDSNSETKPFDRQLSEFSGRVGLVVSVTDETSVYGNYSEAFTPQFSRQEETFFDEETDESFVEEFVFLPRPSRSEQIEVGIKQQWLEDDLQSSCAVYQIVKDKIVARTLKQRNRGVECDLVGQLTQDWHMILSFNQVDAEIVKSDDDDEGDSIKGNEPRVTPDRVVQFWSSYLKPLNDESKIGFGLGVKHVSERFANNENDVTLAAYERVDLSLYYRYRNTFDLNLHVKNVFDKSYDDGAFDNVPFWINKGRERTVELVLDYEF